MNEKLIKRLGWAGTTLSVLMYVSYLAQIMDNLHGDKGTFIQPAVACVNCIIWIIYGLGSKPKNWPIVIANIPGIVLGAITAFTAL